MASIIITNFDNQCDNVMVFTENVTAEEIEKALRYKGKHFDDITEVPAESVQYYVFDPLWDDGNFSENVKRCCRESENKALADSIGIKVGNRWRVDHLCSENDMEVVSVDYDKAEVTLKDCLYGYKSRAATGEPFTVPFSHVQNCLRYQWNQWIPIDNDRNDIKN